jgi:hypothetical protein
MDKQVKTNRSRLISLAYEVLNHTKTPQKGRRNWKGSRSYHKLSLTRRRLKPTRLRNGKARSCSPSWTTCCRHFSAAFVERSSWQRDSRTGIP